jgi:Fe-S cluster assembly protein SufD
MSIQVSAPAGDAKQSTAVVGENYLSQLVAVAQAASPTIDWLQSLRDEAALRLQAQSFPTSRDEDWRFTDLSSLSKVQWQLGDRQLPQDLPISASLAEAAHRLVFINGVYSAALSATENLPAGLIVSSLSTLTPDQIQEITPYLGQQSGAEEVFTTLNTAGLTDVAIAWIPQNVAITEPIHLVFIATATASPLLIQPRCLVVAGTNSALTLVEQHLSLTEATYFTNSVTEIWVGENAQVNHTRVQTDAQTAFHIGKTAVSQARASRYTCNAISLGAQLSRHHLEIYQTGEQTETMLNGLTSIGGTQLADTHSTIALTHPYGTSRQLHKCIVGDRAHAVFNGRVIVPKAAQLTDAGQLNRNLLLSPKARVDTKPQLEIVADNVKCMHGATVSQLDTDEIFYLQSRGIDVDAAQQLLVYAFAHEVLDQIPVASLQQNLSQRIHEILSTASVVAIADS